MAGSGSRVKTLLHQVLKGLGEGEGLDRALGVCKVVAGGPGSCTLSLVVDKPHTNRGETLHGGFSAHLVDTVTTMALMTNEGGLPGVSVDMSLSYLKAAKIGEEIFIEARTLKKGRTLAFLECEIKNKNGDLLVKGSHTKFIGS
ncbi:acyl-coenzyme A thioesterase 13 [Eurytemora carolleeae]|uniref:acyl-coenzyme A thioesterase 13 n=1 Tax=Eurytemora carolleeae TaxID=1294199 RepID=UPI000C75AE99|nr:acyl-coenzyme A thioesterase 13 [Eurytemora carolleeae]|eukprot:XP_023346911.1 acyl-coenzyme A thioesterase 13-like [Eurytemora affinis]